MNKDRLPTTQQTVTFPVAIGIAKLAGLSEEQTIKSVQKTHRHMKLTKKEIRTIYREVSVTLTLAGYCKGCGFEIANECDFCGECLCEEDGL